MADLYYSNFFASKPQNTNGGKQTMWVRQRWGSSIITLYQEVKLPAGTYTLNADMLASASATGYYSRQAFAARSIIRA
ncbi:MAG: hypothetical protein KBT33_00395 [Prevotellaceae bacterium]|nr:hypothetical protein [Candidatus Minthosoma equi]